MRSEGWRAPLAKYALKAGFQMAAIEKLAGAPDLPDTVMLWRSAYANLLVVPIEPPTDEALRSGAAVGQDWLDVACMSQERADHRVMDAYLLLVSSDQLPDALFPAIQEIELDPTACRKHVAWPCPGTDDEIVWRRLFRITALGLPDSPGASGMTNTPILDSEFQKNLLRDVKDLKGKAAARWHAEHKQAGGEP